MIKAVIFDMDGVLIDSEIEYIRLWKKFYEGRKIDIKLEDLFFLAGSPQETEIKLLVRKCGISYEEAVSLKNEYFRLHKLDYRKIKKAYVNEILEFLKKKGIRIALASTSSFTNINMVLQECEIRNYFELLISGEMFVRSKPDPEIYETCIRKLGIKKENAVVIEDSNYGIRAAKRANLNVIAVNDPVLKYDNHEADYIVKDLHEAERIIEKL